MTRLFALIVLLSGCAAVPGTVVRTPDGSPAPGAKAVLVPPGHDAEITDGATFDDDPAFIRATADEHGRLKMPPATQPSLLVVIHPSGYGVHRQSPGAVMPRDLPLQPWCTVSGLVMRGPSPSTTRPVAAWGDISTGDESPSHDRQRPPGAYAISHLTTDSTGRFTAAHLPAGDVSVALDDKLRWGQLARPLVMVQASPRQIATTQIGGAGRPVRGTIVIPPDLAGRSDLQFRLAMIDPKARRAPLPIPPEIAAGSMTQQAAWAAAFNASDAGKVFQQAEERRWRVAWAHTFPFDVAPDGHFEVDDVPPGEYELYADAVLKLPPGSEPSTKLLGRVKTSFTMPPIAGGRSDEPLVLPPLSIEPTAQVRKGDSAPTFTVPGLDDKPVTLADYRGKYVLLVFWATWCGPCVGEVPYLKKVQSDFGHNPRWVLIGLSADFSPDAPTAFIAKNQMPWRQGYLGDMDHSAVAQSYGVRGIPWILLIGPDGKVVEDDLRGDDMHDAVGRVLRR